MSSTVRDPQPIRNDQIPDELKSERLKTVHEIIAEFGWRHKRRELGRVRRVLVYGHNSKWSTEVVGCDESNHLVLLLGNLETMIGHFVPVQITKACENSLRELPVA
eukprot:Selendium_serpulae@DN1892_c0_g1_i1.p2